jgi:outer membrane biosynthesis protein TonB
LTYERLFDALNGAAVRAAVAERAIKAPGDINPSVPAELSAIAMKALARSPAERYGSAKAMSVEIEEFLNDAGYANSDERIAAYLAELAKPPPAPAPLAPAPPAPAPPALAPPATAPVPEAPSVLTSPPTPPSDPDPSATVIGSPPVRPPVVPMPPKLPDNASPKATLIGTPPAPVDPEPAAPVPAAPTPTTAAPTPVAPIQAEAAEPVRTSSEEAASPHPASVVALPRRHESRSDVLANWAWQTDSVEAMDDDLDIPHSNGKSLLYVIGAGLAVALLVTIIAVGFGGSDAKKTPPQSAQEGSDRGVARAAGAEVAMTGSTPAAVTAAPAGAAAPAAGPEGSGSAEAGSASEAPAEPAKPEASKPEPKPEPSKPEPAKLAKPEPAKVVKPELAKSEPAKAKPEPRIARTDPPKDKAPKSDRVARVDPKPSKSSKGALADPFASPKKTDSTKIDVENAYRAGLQQFARGDTRGALASLRTSLASNPNYAPTWRGLGLVFEKLGEKDQARAAFKRYLQLSPGAGDADQIRGRLERLGS